MASSSSEVRATRGDWWGLATVSMQLLALSLFAPLSLWAGNEARSPEVARLLLISLASFVSSMTGVAVLSALWGLRRAGAVIAVLLFGTFGWLALTKTVLALARPLGISPASIAVLVVGTLVFLAVRYGETQTFRLSASVVALTIVAVPIASLARSAARVEGPPSIGQQVKFEAGSARPDLYLVVLDGYGRSDVLSDLYGFDNQPFIEDLTGRGFHVPANAQTNYSMTYAALATALAMDYPIQDGHIATENDRRRFYAVLGGSNPVVESLRNAGYRYVHLESGWGGTRCGTPVDQCIESLFLDESVWTVFQMTPLEWVLEHRWGHAFSQNGLHSLDELIRVAAEPTAGPKFVFAHVLLPHAPLHVQRDCTVVPRPVTSGGVISEGPMPKAELDLRRAAYVEQIRCVNEKLLAFLGALGPSSDAVIIFTGDHGPDSLGQISKPLDQWTEDDLRERFSIFSGYRVPTHCRKALYPDITLVNSFRVVLGCVSGSEIPLLPDQNYVVTYLERSDPNRNPTKLVEVP